MTALASRMKMRKQIVQRRIPTEVAVELTIHRITGIADHRTPDLLACLQVASEDGDSVRTTHGRINAVARARLAVENRVRVGDEVFNARVFQQGFDARLVGAFGKPYAARATAKMFAIILDCDFDLRPP